MENVDHDVLNSCSHWLAQGYCALLVTVVKTWGSSPRPEGAMLAVRDDGLVVGSVSGGCIEDDLIERVRRRGIKSLRPEVIRYGISADEAHRFGLPCGGTIELVLEPLNGSRWVSELCRKLESGRLVSRRVDMITGAVCLDDTTVVSGVSLDGQQLTTIHGPRYRMLIIGAGQLSRYLSQIAGGLDYRVTVCDPRDEYADGWNLPNSTIVRTMPDDTVIDMALDERCAVIALTHDPKLDDLALIEALKTPAFYVGALGSRRNNAARRTRLKEFALGSDELSRLRGPVGLYIGSRTPPEIAVSILAEVTAVKNGVSISALLQVEGAKAALEIAAREATTCAL
jgi:xanthine dehydrogenase accessory factor